MKKTTITKKICFLLLLLSFFPAIYFIWLFQGVIRYDFVDANKFIKKEYDVGSFLVAQGYNDLFYTGFKKTISTNKDFIIQPFSADMRKPKKPPVVFLMIFNKSLDYIGHITYEYYYYMENEQDILASINKHGNEVWHYPGGKAVSASSLIKFKEGHDDGVVYINKIMFGNNKGGYREERPYAFKSLFKMGTKKEARLNNIYDVLDSKHKTILSVDMKSGKLLNKEAYDYGDGCGRERTVLMCPTKKYYFEIKKDVLWITEEEVDLKNISYALNASFGTYIMPEILMPSFSSHLTSVIPFPGVNEVTLVNTNRSNFAKKISGLVGIDISQSAFVYKNKISGFIKGTYIDSEIVSLSECEYIILLSEYSKDKRSGKKISLFDVCKFKEYN